MTLWQSCRTTEYTVPAIVFPEFPVVHNYKILDNGQVAVDEEFFRELLRYKIEIQSLEEMYGRLQQTYHTW